MTTIARPLDTSGETYPPLRPVEALPQTLEEYLEVHTIRSVGDAEKFRFATRFHFEIITDDGEERAATLTMPKDVSRQLTDNPVVRTGAWWTSKQGHNAHDDLHFAKVGLPTWYIAAPGESAPGRTTHSLARAALHPLQTISHLRNIELDRTAAIIHASLDALPHLQPMYDINTDEIAVMGESHGAMTGLHVVAQAADHDRQVVTAQLVASCYLDPINNLSALRTIGSQLPAELAAIVSVARNASPNVRRHLLRTIDPSPLAIMGQLAMWPTLHSGKPRQAISRIGSDQHMGITTFEGDKSGQPALIKAAFQDFPNVVVRPHRGAHMSIPEPLVLEEVTTALVEKLAV